MNREELHTRLREHERRIDAFARRVSGIDPHYLAAEKYAADWEEYYYELVQFWAEHMVPLLSDVFKYSPADARFIGAPIDYLIFDGYTAVKDGSSELPITVVLADVKTGEARLNRTERKIKEAVEAGRVKWETIRLDF